MNIKSFFALILGKIVSFLTKALKLGGGSAAPGYYALKINPDLISNLAAQIPQTIIITGTNGKTTTARILAHFVQNQGLKVLRNTTGSNLERGIASALISHTNFITGKLENVDLAIWELDESAFNSLSLKLKPDVAIFLNIFRDQLDRYGEIDSTLKKWSETVSKFNKKTRIFINGDDQNLLELKDYFKGKVQTFGVENFKISGERKLLNPAKKLNFEAKNIKERGLSGIDFELETVSGKWKISLPIPGIYHVYDFLAAFSVAEYLELKTSAIINSFKNFSPAFGRVEKFNLPGNHEGYIFLIKNPAGANQIFKTIKRDLRENDCLLIALNDNLADGRDVSWIWDADFEEFQNLSGIKTKNLKVICSGQRAYDLALRLKYAGFDLNLLIHQSLENAFNEALKALEGLPAGRQGRLFILPTYTCLLKLQQILTDNKIKKEYWKED